MDIFVLWLMSLLSYFICPKNFLSNVCAIIALFIAWKGVYTALNAYKEFKQQQKNATWNFYSNLSAFLRSLKLSIGENYKVAANVMEFFYKPIPEKDCVETLEVEHLRKLASDFLNYLYTAKEQVPPVDNFIEWKEKRTILIDFLNNTLFLGVRSDWQSKDETDNKRKEILDIITYMENGIDKVINSKFDLKRGT
jgi:hypothetical protein